MLAVQMTDRVYRDTGVRLNMMRLASWTLAQLAAELPDSVSPEDARPTAPKGLMRLFRSAEATSQ